MRKLLSIAVIFLGFSVAAVAQHGHEGGGHASAPAPHFSAPQHAAPAPRGTYRGGYRGVAPRGGFRGGVGFRDWYGNRPEYRRFGWVHYRGWYYHPYAYLGPGYCYTGIWDGPFFTFGFNAARWRVVDFDLGIVGGWGGCSYIMDDPYHYGWYLMYDQQTGQYVHVEQY